METAPASLVAVGISRGTPRFPVGYRYRRLMELAPDGWMLGIDDDARFEEVYVKKLERLGVDRIMEGLGKISDEEGGADLCLLCFEQVVGPNAQVCHRRQFASWWFEKTGQPVEELAADGCALRQDPQEPLF